MLHRHVAARSLPRLRATSLPKAHAHLYPNQQAAAESKSQKEGHADNHSIDAVHASHGKAGSRPDVTQHRESNTTPESGGFQPGQHGEQVSGHGPGQGESVGGKEQAASESYTELAKRSLGLGDSKRSFSTSALRLAAKGGDKAAGAQNEHIVHHEAGEQDEMPAVRDNAELPSKKGESSSSTQAASPNKGKDPHPAAGQDQAVGYGSGPGTSGKQTKRDFSTSAYLGAKLQRQKPTGHSSDGLPNYTEGFYNAPPQTSHITPQQGSVPQQALRRYVRGTPEPSSFKLGYDYVDYTSPQTYQAPRPSSSLPPSSTSTDAANPFTTEVDIEKRDLKLPPDFDTEVRGQWMQKPRGEEKELPPAGATPTGGTREIRADPKGPRDAEKTTDKVQSPPAGHSDAAKVAKKQVAKAKGADPASSTGAKDSAEGKPAFPGATLKEGEHETTLAASGRGPRKARSGPAASKS